MKRQPKLLSLAALLLFQAFFIFVPMTILGKAINWPASLDLSPAEVLPLILEKESAVRFGYGLYFVWSFVFAATAIFIVRISSRNGSFSTLAVIACAFGAASALARCAGITRWLSASMSLARDYSAAKDLPHKREVIEVVQSAVNAYGGTIGEMVGVGVCTSGWLICTGLVILSTRRLPSAFGWVALAVSAVSASPLLSSMGLMGEVSPSLTVTSVNLWIAGVAVWLLVKGLPPDELNSLAPTTRSRNILDSLSH